MSTAVPPMHTISMSVLEIILTAIPFVLAIGLLALTWRLNIVSKMYRLSAEVLRVMGDTIRNIAEEDELSEGQRIYIVMTARYVLDNWEETYDLEDSWRSYKEAEDKEQWVHDKVYSLLKLEEIQQ